MLYTDISQWEHTVRGAQYDKAIWCWRKLSILFAIIIACAHHIDFDTCIIGLVWSLEQAVKISLESSVSYTVVSLVLHHSHSALLPKYMGFVIGKVSEKKMEQA